MCRRCRLSPALIPDKQGDSHACQDGEHEGAGDVGALDVVHRRTVLLQKLAHVIVGLQDGRADAALHTGGQFTIKAGEQAADHGCEHGEGDGAHDDGDQYMRHFPS